MRLKEITIRNNAILDLYNTKPDDEINDLNSILNNPN